jgi:outer membrane protein OmpU
MKKVLIASTALVMIAGAAAAEVKVSGSARMGVIYNGSDAQFSSRVRVVFDMSGETDGGLSFGASMRADQNGGNSSGIANGDSTVFISGAFGKLTMGDVGGAPDSLVGQTSGVGYGPYDGLQEIDFLGTDKTAAYYEYTSGAFTVGVGAGQPTGPNKNVNIAVKYAAGNYSVALGYEDASGALLGVGDTQISAKGTATFGAATVKAKIVSQDSKPDTAYSLSLDYVVAGTTLTGFYTDFGTGVQHVGIGASYDLGGGATLAGGIVQQMNPSTVVTGDATFADLGVKFSF